MRLAPLLFVAAVLTAGPVATASTASPIACGDREKIDETLRDSYGERPQLMGVAENGSLMELYASKKGSWSIVVTTPGGPACLVSFGDGFEPVAEDLVVAEETL